MILVPAFIYLYKMEDKKARGTSAFCILIMVITSSFFYYRGDFIDWKLSLLCAVGGCVGGFLGSIILKKISEKILKIIFICMLIFVSIKMIV